MKKLSITETSFETATSVIQTRSVSYEVKYPKENTDSISQQITNKKIVL
ncbi:hypothetical protein [Chryseobacterium lathyri]|uniref:Uncharacterized protein n=1 Tax=Chryseobacterium lathyri TaxID=395933 RepID=A0ABT9SMX1_9FLAO|nr:hypothetical protein [Chryseobacterium lathyri]MDP9960801.1 hypothetical protein [Chryseobacterium lathyri]